MYTGRDLEVIVKAARADARREAIEECVADAKIITDMLVALEKAKKVIDGLVDQQAMPNCWWQVDYADILAAIAKAKGEA